MNGHSRIKRTNPQFAARLAALSVAIIFGIGFAGSSAWAGGPVDRHAVSSLSTNDGQAEPLDSDDFLLDDDAGPDEQILPDPEKLPAPVFPAEKNCFGVPDSRFRSWYNVGSTPVITHASAFENEGDTKLESTEVVEVQTTITAGAEFSVGVSASAEVLVGELKGETSLKVQASGSHTTKTSISTKITVPKNSLYVYFKGTVKVSGGFTEFECSDDWRIERGSGIARSFTVDTTGQVNCAKTPRRALAKLAKKQYCQ